MRLSLSGLLGSSVVAGLRRLEEMHWGSSLAFGQSASRTSVSSVKLREVKAAKPGENAKPVIQ